MATVSSPMERSKMAITPQQPQTAAVQYPGVKPISSGLTRPPAPGSSPVGGTTHLAQYLKMPEPTPPKTRAGGISLTNPSAGTGQLGSWGTPRAPGSIGGGVPAPAAPAPASVPPGMVPPAPPRPAPGPAVPATPATPGVAPATPATPATPSRSDQMGKSLWEMLMGMMNSPSAYDQSVVQQTRQQG